MARKDGIHHAIARNAKLSIVQAQAAERHNERQKECYSNTDINKERIRFNVHFKAPLDSYTAIFDKMEASGDISTRGLRPDANKFCELVFDVNSAYFESHGGYPFAQQFYAESYEAAKAIVGGEKYIVSAVMHADERNVRLSDEQGKDIYHYHLHVVYIPVVKKEIRFTKRCKDPTLIGKVKQTVMQVSSSKKWFSQQALDEHGEPLLAKNGNPVLKSSYSELQDLFFEHMHKAGYTDLERGEHGSGEEHLTVIEYKVSEEKKRLAVLTKESEKALKELADKDEKRIKVESCILDAEVQLQRLTEAKRKETENYNDIIRSIEKIKASTHEFDGDPDNVIPQPSTLESAKVYREKKIKPFLAKCIQTIRALSHNYHKLRSSFQQLEEKLIYEKAEHDRYSKMAMFYEKECDELSKKAKEYDLIIQHYGKQEVSRVLNFERTKATDERTKDDPLER